MAAQTEVEPDSSGVLETSTSSPVVRTHARRVTADVPPQSPETLSQFLRTPPGPPGSPQLPSNPFQGSRAPEEPGATYVQHNVRNETHVSMDPFISARANEAIERSRNEMRSEAVQFIEQTTGRIQGEANQYAERVQLEAQRVVGESQVQVIQTQERLEEARAETSQLMAMATQEVETIRAQANAEFANLKNQAQLKIASLEGKLYEVVQMNGALTKRHEEQISLIETLLKRVDEQTSVISSMRLNSVSSASNPNGAALGAVDHSSVRDGPVHMSIATPRGF